jgi:tripartite-type tricarboxylate transporter receptor subunit TctC
MYPASHYPLMVRFDRDEPLRNMSMKTFASGVCTTLFASMAVLTIAHAAAPWPDKIVRIVVPFIAGGGTDIHARIVGDELSKMLGQQFLIVNMPGGTAQVGYGYVAKAPADGYTFVMGTGGLTILPSLYTKLPFQPLKDFEPVSQLVRIQNVMVVHPSVPAKTLKEFIALAKAQPGKITYASTGVGNPPHLAGELLKTMAKIDIYHVAYKADNVVMPDLIGGRLEMFISPLAVALPFVEAKRLRAIAVTAKTRAPALPDVPTMDEAGLKGYEITSWYGILAPAGTPREIVDRMNVALVKIVAMPAVREKFAQNGSEPTGTSVEEFRRIIEGNLKNFARIIEASGAKPLD